jgi:hypothetical protein
MADLATLVCFGSLVIDKLFKDINMETVFWCGVVFARAKASSLVLVLK